MKSARPRPIYFKKLEEEYPVGFKYIPPDLESGEIVDSAVVTEGSGGLSLDGSPILTDDTVTHKISGGGSVGKKYILKFKTTTTAAKVLVDTILVEIVED